MSSDVYSADRDLTAELASPEAGHVGVPVDAICSGCQRTRVKRARLEELGFSPEVDPATVEATNCTSFKHVCHSCQSATWWNPIAILSGVIDRERGE